MIAETDSFVTYAYFLFYLRKNHSSTTTFSGPNVKQSPAEENRTKQNFQNYKGNVSPLLPKRKNFQSWWRVFIVFMIKAQIHRGKEMLEMRGQKYIWEFFICFFSYSIVNTMKFWVLETLVIYYETLKTFFSSFAAFFRLKSLFCLFVTFKLVLLITFLSFLFVFYLLNLTRLVATTRDVL